MTPVSLRLNLTPEVLAKLTTAVANREGKLRHFVRIKRTQWLDPHYEVDLSVLCVYELKSPTVESVTVTHEMFSELLDLLDLFPLLEKPTQHQ